MIKAIVSPSLHSAAPCGRLGAIPDAAGCSLRPIRVALVNDYEIVLRGLHGMLAPFRDRIVIVEHDIRTTPDRVADVALFDTFASRRSALDRAHQMISEDLVDHVVLYTWDLSYELLEGACAIGVSGVIPKSATAETLVGMVEQVVAGERIGLDGMIRSPRRASSEALSVREQEVLALLALGHTNSEIGAELYISIDTVKTYVRRVFTKLGINNRTQAALRAVDHAITPRPSASAAGRMVVS